MKGFMAVPETLRMAGRNDGLGGIRFVTQILVSAALLSILAGLEIGWAFAWRTLIAAELVFGVSSGAGGLGWYIFQARNELYTDRVFAGLAAVIIIGFVVENAVFRTAENPTVNRWGMPRRPSRSSRSPHPSVPRSRTSTSRVSAMAPSGGFMMLWPASASWCFVPPHPASRVRLPAPLGGRRPALLGQSDHPALCGDRLLAAPPGHAPRHRARRPPGLSKGRQMWGK